MAATGVARTPVGLGGKAAEPGEQATSPRVIRASSTRIDRLNADQVAPLLPQASAKEETAPSGARKTTEVMEVNTVLHSPAGGLSQHLHDSRRRRPEHLDSRRGVQRLVVGA